ncbi:MAG: DUF2313 domain-containing protein [Pseudomonadota bacterium]|nr:DUF2313 domain-containing protein [Pseudomonadota bacterium]
MSHADLLANLLPLTSYAPDNALLVSLLAADGAALDAAYGSAQALQIEFDPRTTAALFADWETTAGLPDACIGGGQTTGQRRAALVAKWAGQGGQTGAYFVALAAAMGYAITITEFRPHDVNLDVNAPLFDAAWRYAWQINAALDTVTVLTVNDTVIDPLSAWGNQALECMLTRLKPAHTHVIFSYS